MKSICLKPQINLESGFTRKICCHNLNPLSQQGGYAAANAKNFFIIPLYKISFSFLTKALPFLIQKINLYWNLLDIFYIYKNLWYFLQSRGRKNHKIEIFKVIIFLFRICIACLLVWLPFCSFYSPSRIFLLFILSWVYNFPIIIICHFHFRFFLCFEGQENLVEIVWEDINEQVGFVPVALLLFLLV